MAREIEQTPTGHDEHVVSVAAVDPPERGAVFLDKGRRGVEPQLRERVVERVVLQLKDCGGVVDAGQGLKSGKEVLDARNSRIAVGGWLLRDQ